jgi:two-component system chemotaxis response regulator CheY
MARIVLCDDSRTILTLFGAKLQAAGHSVVGKASDGEQGVKMYEATRPDLVLLDITMPNKDGRECLADIIKSDPSAKVIMISALRDDAVVAECLKLGAKGFISKNQVYDDANFEKGVLSMIDSVLKAA